MTTTLNTAEQLAAIVGRVSYFRNGFERPENPRFA
jgi:hypothetical protein